MEGTIMIKLTYENDSPVWVDPKFVSHVLAQEGTTSIHVMNYGAIIVKEDAAAVVKMIEAAQPVRGFISSLFNRS